MRPSVTITFPDGCAVTYSHPDGDPFPRADLVPGPDGDLHNDPDGNAVAHAVARAYLRAIAVSDDDPSADTDY